MALCFKQRALLKQLSQPMIFTGFSLQCHMPWERQGSSLVLPLPQPSLLELTQPSLPMPSLSPRFLVLVSVDMENQVLHSGEPREDMKAMRFNSLASSFCAFNGSDLASVCQQLLLGQPGLKAAFQRGRPTVSRAIKCLKKLEHSNSCKYDKTT